MQRTSQHRTDKMNSEQLQGSRGQTSLDPIDHKVEIASVLARIGMSQVFASSKRLFSLLEFIVGNATSGDRALKETAIGVGFCGRDPSYDPKKDSIVRTQASRLRDRLDEYYRTEGAHDPLIIQLNRGSYVPTFLQREAAEAPVPVVEEASRPTASPSAPSWRRFATWVASAAGLAAVAAGALYFGTGSRPLPKVGAYVQLTRDGAPKWLAGTDGVRIYYGTGNFTDPGLAQIPVSGGESVPSRLPVRGLRPLGLSPRGDRLLLSDYYPGNLWSLNLIDANLSRLGEAVGPEAAWSPDGKMLVYTRDTDLWIAAADGSQIRKLVTIPSRRLYDPQWSPDGTRLRLSVWETLPGVPSLWEVSADGRNPHPLFPGWHKPPDEEGGRWTADGSYYVFRSGGQLWALDEGLRLAGQVKAPFQITSSPSRMSSPLPSKDGKQLFAAGQTDRGALVRFDSGSGKWTPYLSGMSAEWVRYSPDGKWMAYVTYPEGVLWRSRPDGSERLRLNGPPLYLGSLEWSPDGKRIACSGNVAGGQSRVYVFSLEGARTELAVAGSSERLGGPSWFPDGRRLAVQVDLYPKPYEIQVVDTSRGQASTTPGSQDMYGPAVSPDGSRILAIRRHPISLMMYDLRAGRWSELARVAGGFPNWSQDGKHVYFLRFPDKPSVLKIRASDGHVETFADLADVHLTGHIGCWLGLGPGDSPLVLRGAGTQDIYRLELEK
jgi:Tol biopolymer transport system component